MKGIIQLPEGLDPNDYLAVVVARWEQAEATFDEERTPTVHYMPCLDHEAAIEVEGYCPCFGGLEIDWDKTDIWRNE